MPQIAVEVSAPDEAVADQRDVRGRLSEGAVSEGPVAPLPPVPVLTAAVDAAAAVLAGEAPVERWTGAMHALSSVLPWWRAALVASRAISPGRAWARPVASAGVCGDGYQLRTRVGAPLVA